MKQKLFEKTKFGKFEVKNRFVRSAAGAGVASQEGFVSDDVLYTYKKLAQGGVGLIITQMITAFQDENTPQYNLRIDNDIYINGLKELSQIIHDNSSKVICQLGGYGTFLNQKPKVKPIGPSEIKDDMSGITARKMTESDIQRLVIEFSNSAERAKRAGFDGVQIHACHGLLLSKFLSPHYNLRTDKYGGNIKKRAQILVEILEAVKTKCGQDFTVLIKINSSDFTDEINGFTIELCRETCQLLSKRGYDAIEISGGLVVGKVSPARPKNEIAYHKSYAASIASEINTPVIVVGGIRNFDVAKDIIESTNIKGISLVRALIREPDLINKWRNKINVESKCVLCNKCFTTDGEKCIFNN